MASGSASHHRHSRSTCAGGVVVMTSPHELSLDAVLEQELQEWHYEHEKHRANDDLLGFYKWSNANPEAIKELYEYVKKCVDNDVPCSSRTTLDYLRFYSDLAIEAYRTGSKGFKVPNNFGALIARILVKSFPECSKFFKLNPSYYDLLDNEQIPVFGTTVDLVWTVVPDVT